MSERFGRTKSASAVTRAAATTFVLVLVAAITVSSGEALNEPPIELTPDTPVVDVLHELGEEWPAHFVDENGVRRRPSPELVLAGYEIVTQGETSKLNGTKGRVSEEFVCTHCHNTRREDSDLAQADPEARLAYLVEKGGRLLPATTLWGTVNRDSWYNGDNIKKYGAELVEPARADLAKAVQLCAEHCAQGRPLNDIELNAVLAYLISLELTLGDLGYDPASLAKMTQARRAPRRHREIRGEIRRRYLGASPATFLDPASSIPDAGDPQRGEQILRHSCAACHSATGPGFPKLEANATTRDRLKKGFAKGWLPQLLREGTHPMEGEKSRYMPLFSAERLSAQQVADLRAWARGDAAPDSNAPARREIERRLARSLFELALAPILAERCLDCHGPRRPKGGFRCDDEASLREVVRDRSLLRRISLPADHEDRMPKKGDPLSEAEIAAFRAWVEGGAPIDEKAVKDAAKALAKRAKASDDSSAGAAPRSGAGNDPFTKTIAPILRQSCTRCHGFGRARGGLRLHNHRGVLNAITPGKPEESELLRRIRLPADHEDHMPRKGGPVSETNIQKIEAWIKAGAPGPGSR